MVYYSIFKVPVSALPVYTLSQNICRITLKYNVITAVPATESRGGKEDNPGLMIPGIPPWSRKYPM